MIKICVLGALGRMGSGIVKEVVKDENTILAAVVEDKSCPKIGQEIGSLLGIDKLDVNLSGSLEDVIENVDVVIDFTAAEALENNLDIVKKYNKKIVIGTTGLSLEQKQSIKQSGNEIACLFSPNMSVGVNLLFKIVGEAAKILGDDFDIEIIEAHHRFKKDAPSGTALKLAEVIADSLGRNVNEDCVHGREGIVGERTKKEIGMHAVRAGDIVGEHTVMYGGIGEKVEISHKAQSRETFMKGAVRAAKFLADKDKGFFDMLDVLK
jgi:4-hydroxy-tetrahydrodipicolinate reductase